MILQELQDSEFHIAILLVLNGIGLFLKITE